MEWYEAAFDRLYPVLYPHRDSAEAKRAIQTFFHLFDQRSPVLDLATGGGRYLTALLDRGIAAYGLDLSHYLLQVSAGESRHRGRLIQADMRTLPFADASFGGIINMFTSFGYFSTDMDNLLVMREVSRILKPGGVFLFDFINAEKIAANLLAETQRESGGYDIVEKRTIEEHNKYLVKRATLTEQQTGRQQHIEERLRLYTKEDLLMMLNSVQLTPQAVHGDYQANDFVPGVSDRVIIVSSKHVDVR